MYIVRSSCPFDIRISHDHDIALCPSRLLVGRGLGENCRKPDTGTMLIAFPTAQMPSNN